MKRISANLLRYIELILSTFLCLFVFFGKNHDEYGLILNNGLIAIPSIIYAVILICLLLEYKKTNTFPGIRFFMIFIIFGIALLMYSDGKYFSRFNSTLWVFSIPMVISIIVTIIKNGMPVDKTKIETGVNKTLPIGIVTKKQLYISYLIWGILILLLVLYLVLNITHVIEIPFWIVCIFIFAYGIIFVYISALKLNPLNASLKIINLNLSYNEFKKEIENFKQNRLHPETINQINLLLANYTHAVDTLEAYKYFEISREPKAKNYIHWYKVVRALYYSNKANKEELDKCLADLRTNPKNEQLSISIERGYIIKHTKDIIENIESFYPLNTKLAFSNITNCHTLMIYYYNREDKENAKKYADIILNYKSDLQKYNSDALAVIENRLIEEEKKIEE